MRASAALTALSAIAGAGCHATPSPSVDVPIAPAPVAVVTSPSPPPAQSAVLPVQDAAVDDSCAEVAEPAEASWRGRAISTGTMPGPHWLRTVALTLSGTNAVLTLRELTAQRRPADGRAWTWTCRHAERHVASVERRRDTLVLTFAPAQGGAASPVRVTCRSESTRLARPDDVRVEQPSPHEGCHRHVWSTALRDARTLMICSTSLDAPLSPLWIGTFNFEDGAARATFLGAGGGVEHLTIDEDDCESPRKALRWVPKDGGFAPVQ